MDHSTNNSGSSSFESGNFTPSTLQLFNYLPACFGGDFELEKIFLTDIHSSALAQLAEGYPFALQSFIRGQSFGLHLGENGCFVSLTRSKDRSEIEWKAVAEATGDQFTIKSTTSGLGWTCTQPNEPITMSQRPSKWKVAPATGCNPNIVQFQAVANSDGLPVESAWFLGIVNKKAVLQRNQGTSQPLIWQLKFL